MSRAGSAKRPSSGISWTIAGTFPYGCRYIAVRYIALLEIPCQAQSAPPRQASSTYGHALAQRRRQVA
jgi:hypothetical protein